MKKRTQCPEIIAWEVQSLCRLNMKVCIEAETVEICPEHVAADAEINREEETNGETNQPPVRGAVRIQQ